MADAKKKLGLLLGVAKPAEDASDDLVSDSPKTMAARGMFDALKNDDFPAFEEALSTFIDASNTPAGEDPAKDLPPLELDD